MKIYSTLTRQKEEFQPLKPGEVGFYVCGPTVYNHIHIGNARTFISFDVIRRYLEFSNYQVTFVQNITDVDDKIINRAAEENITPEAVAAKYTAAFITVMHQLGVLDPTIRPQATQEMASMIELIENLIDAGHAYTVAGDVYFAVRSYPEYGALSGRDIDQLLSGARVEIDERKRDALDFALWKAAKPGEPSWSSPWGPGRPGWHIECSAMSRRYLGDSFDIHGGGEDLVFPHHENEIAQSQAAGNGFARYWLHSGMLTIKQEKMSKSLGNFLLLKDVLELVRPQALRLLMLQSHYRSPFDYSPTRLVEAEAALERVENALRNLEWAIQSAPPAGTPAEQAAGIPARPPAEPSPATPPAEPSSIDQPAMQLEQAVKSTKQRFIEQMDDDFNTAGAVAAIYDLVSEANSAVANGLTSATQTQAALTAADTIRELLAVLGIDLSSLAADQPLNSSNSSLELPPAIIDLAQKLVGYSGSDSTEAVDLLIEQRNQARTTRDWQAADAVRDGLTALGLVVEDTASGTRVFQAYRQTDE